MAFKIAPSAARPKKLANCLAAFSDDDSDQVVQTSSKVPDTGLAAAEGHRSQGLRHEGHGSTSDTVESSAAITWVDKGSAFAENGDTTSALRCWDQSLLIDPNNGRVHEMRAQVLNEQGRSFEALQAAQQAVTLCPDWPDALITLARVQLNYGEPLLALQSYQAAARLHPGHPDLVQELPAAQMYAKLHARQQQQQPGSRAHVVDHAHMGAGEDQTAGAEGEPLHGTADGLHSHSPAGPVAAVEGTPPAVMAILHEGRGHSDSST